MRFFQLIGNRKRLILFFFLVPCIAIVELISVALIIPIINYFGGNKSEIGQLFPDIKEFHILLIFGLFTVFSFTSRSLFERFRILFSLSIAPNVQNEILRVYESSSWENNASKDLTEFIALTTTYVYEFVNKRVTPVFNMYYSLVVILVLVGGMLLFIDPTIVYVIGGLTLIYGLIALGLRGLIRNISIESKRSLDAMYGNLRFIYKNFINIIILNEEPRKRENVVHSSKVHFRYQGLNRFYGVLPKYILEGLLIFVLVLILYLNNDIDLGRVIFILMLAQKAIPRVQSLFNSYVLFGGGEFAHNEIDRFISSGESHRWPIITSGIGHEITLSYPEIKRDETTILSNIHLSIGFNNWYLIKGASGSGKSSLLKAIIGFLPVAKASINIPGYQSYREWLKNEVYYLDQEMSFTPGTIIDIARDVNDSITEDEINRLLGLFSLEFEPSHYIESEAANVSGGQRQRLFLVLAILSDKRLIIMDEPTSALNSKLERESFLVLKEELIDKSVICVTHSENIDKYFEHIIDLNG